MKKILVFAFTFVMLLSLCACAPEIDDIRGTQTDNTITEQPTLQTEDPVSTPNPENFSFGTASGLTYENEFIGIGCTLPEGWTFYDDAQIKELNNLSADMAGEEFAEIIEDASIIYDMMATGSNQADSVNINLEKIDALRLLTLDLAKNFENVMPTIKEAFENMGYTNITSKIGTLEIDGKEFVSMDTQAEINGVTLYQKQFAVKCNGYLANITVSTYFENTAESILDNFYLL